MTPWQIVGLIFVFLVVLAFIGLVIAANHYFYFELSREERKEKMENDGW